MKILFDQGTPAPLRKALMGHVVETAFERGWSTLQNGQLLTVAEAAGFDALVTTDRNVKHQQNLAARRIAVVILTTTSWPRIELQQSRVLQAVEAATAGACIEVPID